MRLLVECSECERQYDAGKRRAGTRFRCHCGQVLTVQQPQGRDARVVRCSSCGASRKDDDPRCSYCESEFTLHERDLNTVCPHCLAFVSDRAKFCHYCGVALVPELEAGTDSELRCPACDDHPNLVSKRRGAERVTILECNQCAGLWMGRDTFERLVERTRKGKSPPPTIAENPRHATAHVGIRNDSTESNTDDRGWSYRPCAVCGELMNRRNYGQDSGVIIDHCREHGIWFDADELARIIAWVRAGGDLKPKPEPAPPRRHYHSQSAWGEPSASGGFLGGLLEFLIRVPFWW